jgi:hypothetical protein
MAKKRVVVVVNKWWECDPVLFALLHDNARPKERLGWPSIHGHPRPRPDQSNLPKEDPSPKPRAVFDLQRTTVEVWCVSDLLEHLEDKSKYQSSSEQKARRLPLVFGDSAADLVVAVGTAASVGALPLNGSVVIGTNVFLHNVHPDGTNKDSNWQDGPFDTLLSSSLTTEVFQKITETPRGLKPLRDRFLPSPLAPAPCADLIPEYDAVALGTVNVTDYREYAKADTEVVDAYRNSKATAPIGSVDTTHGLVRVFGGDRFLFVSGIVNRLGHFADEVAPREYAQNTAAAHNAGVAVAWVLPRIDGVL